MNYFAPVIGENGLTSSKHMNGYFLDQEALRGRGNSQVSPSLMYYPFSKFKYIHILLKSWSFKNLDFSHCLRFLMLLFPVTSQKTAM